MVWTGNGKAGRENTTAERRGQVQAHSSWALPSRRAQDAAGSIGAPAHAHLGVARSPPAATLPSSNPGGAPYPAERKLCGRETRTRLPPGRHARDGEGRAAPAAERAATSGRLLAHRSPRRGGAGPGAGHCGKGVDGAACENPPRAWRARPQRGGEGGVGLG